LKKQTLVQFESKSQHLFFVNFRKENCDSPTRKSTAFEDLTLVQGKKEHEKFTLKKQTLVQFESKIQFEFSC
jgi:hypothetical protein